jgi:hypothetical protein
MTRASIGAISLSNIAKALTPAYPRVLSIIVDAKISALEFINNSPEGIRTDISSVAEHSSLAKKIM